MAFEDRKSENKERRDLERDDRESFVLGDQQTGGKQQTGNGKDEDSDLITRAWESIKESLGLEAAGDKQEPRGERGK
jgi:hypothetical protein